MYMLAGAGLLLTGFTTAQSGLSEECRGEYENAVAMYDELGNMGFDGFCPMDYQVAFSDGETDRVIGYHDGDYKTEQRDAVYDGLVGSIYENEGRYEVIVPDYEIWLATGSSAPLSAVIWHESFHAYQITTFDPMRQMPEAMMSETQLAQKLDGDVKQKRLFEKELAILGRITDEENTCDATDIAIEYIRVKKERDALLDQAFRASEDYYTMLEGTAYYIESKAVCFVNGEKAYQENYIDTAVTYADGNAKYYRLGMLECLLLDQLDPDWKSGYAFDQPLDALISDYVMER